jgi:HEAT repeat protein
MSSTCALRSRLALVDDRVGPDLVAVVEREREPGVVLCAIEALGALRDPVAVPALVKRLGVENDAATKRALGHIGDARAASALAKAAAETPRLRRRPFRRALRKLFFGRHENLR